MSRLLPRFLTELTFLICFIFQYILIYYGPFFSSDSVSFPFVVYHSSPFLFWSSLHLNLGLLLVLLFPLNFLSSAFLGCFTSDQSYCILVTKHACVTTSIIFIFGLQSPSPLVLNILSAFPSYILSVSLSLVNSHAHFHRGTMVLYTALLLVLFASTGDICLSSQLA